MSETLPNSQLCWQANPALAARSWANPGLEALTVSDLEGLAIEFLGHGTSTFFALADVFSELHRRGGIEALEESCRRLGYPAARAADYVRVANDWPEEERARFPAFSFTHFQILTDRTAAEGDTPEERRERKREYAERAADESMSARRLRRTIEEELRPESPTPADALVELLLEGLEKRLRAEEPGTWPLVAETVRAHLVERRGAVLERYALVERR